MRFLTLASPGSAEVRVRGSAFLGHAAPVASDEEASQLLAARRRDHFDATHHCSAWRLRDGTARSHDAGEPSGSAGAPILAAIGGAGLVDCAVIVSRYFGGTKLGVGGLVRAYGGAAAAALAVAPRREGLAAIRLRLTYDYRHTAAVMRTLERTETHEVRVGFAAGGRRGQVDFAVPFDAEPEVRTLLRDATAGEAAPDLLEACVIYSRGSA